jgi:hypothetical protein
MRIKRRQIGTAGLVYRHRDGTVIQGCRACSKWTEHTRWRPAIRAARGHAAWHAANPPARRPVGRYVPTANGIRAIGGGG